MAALCAISWLAAFISDTIIFPIWLDWSPGRTVSQWVWASSFKNLGGYVRFFFIYIPDFVVLFGLGMTTGLLYRRHWFPLSLVIPTAFLIEDFHFFVSWMGVILKGALGLTVFFFVVFLCTYASPLAGAFLGSHFRNTQPIDPMSCRTCGYNLTGNTSGTCPECGEAI